MLFSSCSQVGLGNEIGLPSSAWRGKGVPEHSLGTRNLCVKRTLRYVSGPSIFLGDYSTNLAQLSIFSRRLRNWWAVPALTFYGA